MSRPSRARGLKQGQGRENMWNAMVAPLTGAWIETPYAVLPYQGRWSRPSRARGLKHKQHVIYRQYQRSRPSRARGLKLYNGSTTHWSRSSRPSRARGLKPMSDCTDPSIPTSRPSRARGLKPSTPSILLAASAVAPLTGAWIETLRTDPLATTGSRRAPHGRVD